MKILCFTALIPKFLSESNIFEDKNLEIKSILFFVKVFFSRFM